MPRIHDYQAPPAKLQPASRGMQEWETTARRAGPLYNAAAQDVRERGKLAADAVEAEAWRLNFLNVYHNLRVQQEDAVAQSRERKQFRVQYGRGRSSGDPRFGAGYGMAQGAIAGAVGLSQIAANEFGPPTNDRLVPKGVNKGGKLYDADAPVTINDEWSNLEPPIGDDFSKYPTSTVDDYTQTRDAIAADRARYEGLESSYGDPNKPPSMWNPLNWSPSTWWGSTPAAEAEIPR